MFARAFSAAAFVLALPILAAASTLARADAAPCAEGLLECCQVINTNSRAGSTSLSLASSPPTTGLTELISFSQL